jgi:hypothetical protein
MRLALAMLAASAAFAQTANLSGIVRDSSRAVIPSAAVSLVNEETGATRHVSTTSEGGYLFPFLSVGRYRLNIQAAGFQAFTETGMRLDAGEQRIDATLQPASLGQSVTVNADSAVLGTDAAGVGTLIPRALIENMPLNGRSFQSLIGVTPGVVMTKATFGEQGQFSVNGQRPNANYFTIDGASANIGVSAGLTLVQSASGSLPGLAATGGTNTLVSVEALEEFHVQTSGAAPEYGRMPGAQVVILTRAGTNRYHGALFDFFRNDALDAADWFANAQTLPKPELRQHDFGGVLGGPVRIPRLYDGRNRTFFFFSYEGLRLRQPHVLATDVPSLAVRQSACAACQPFLNAFPLPNRGGGAYGFSPFVATYSDAASLDAASLRLDQHLGSRVTFFGRYNYAPSIYTQRLYALSNPIDVAAGTRTFTAGVTTLLSPEITNDLRFNRSDSTGKSGARLDNFGGAVPFNPQLFYPNGVDPANAFGGYFLSGGINSSFYLGKNVANSQRQWNVVDSVSVFHGSHQFKFGADWRKLDTLNNPRAYDLMAYFVTANGGASGTPSQIVLGDQTEITVYVRNLSLFAQDTWKVAPRLTLTYGVRWELNPAPKGSLPLYTFQGYQNPARMHITTAGTPLYPTRWLNFAPRLAVAWQVNSSTTLRAGFGIFYDLGAGLIGQSAAGFPYFRQKSLAPGTPFPVPAGGATPLPFTLNPPIDTIYGAQQGLRLPLTDEWNLTVERRMGKGRELSLAYVGAAGRHLLRQSYYLNPTQQITEAYLLTNGAFSDFHSFQAQFQQRLTRGFMALASYTLAKSLDNVSSESDLMLQASQLNPLRDRGPSDFDIRQTLTAAFSYSIPSQSRLRALRFATNGWGLDGVAIARTATPVDVTFAQDEGFGLTNLRPDLVAGSPVYLADPNVAGGKKFNPAAFAIQQSYPGRQGTLGRNALRGFPLAQLNLTARREFHIYEALKLQFRAEMFNVMNHPAFADPSGDLYSPEFGQSTQMLAASLGRGGANGGLNPLYQVGGARSIQLALRAVF